MATPAEGVLKSTTAEQLGRVAAELGWTFRKRAVGLEELTHAGLVMGVNANNPARTIRSLDRKSLVPDENLLAMIAVAYSALPRELIE